MALHAFVVMPFGIKEGIDFNKVYRDYIRPALESAGFEVFRADEEMRAGDIRTDMFQELLLADLVIADLSIDNPNVWYELGVRHALRARGVIQINCKRNYMPFDISVDRTLFYHIKDGIPDPEFLEADKASLANFATETMAAWHGRKNSPVYHLLGYLKEPDWKSLRMDEAKEFWEAYEAWEDRVELARRLERTGDIMVLAEEVPSQFLRIEAHCTAGKALLKLGQFSLALGQYEDALAINPENIECRRQKGILLGRLGKYDEAKVWVEALLKDYPCDAESLALLGRIEKEAWVHSWRRNGKSSEEMRGDAANEDSLLRMAIEIYAKGFHMGPSHYYSGINALTLMHLHRHLTGDDTNIQELRLIEGGVRWAVNSAIMKDKKDYWAKATLGDIELLISDKDIVRHTYNDAVAVAEKDWFALNSTRQQIQILKDLCFRPPQVEAALCIFDNALARLKAPWRPRMVFLFSGHMIDAPDRAEPRFPADKEEIAAKAIAEKLDKLGAGQQDLALCGGACGGDILFAEKCLERGLRLEMRIPFAEPVFLKNSVNFAGDRWRDRFYNIKNSPNVSLFVMPNELGPLPKGANAYVRNNLWQLYTALSWGPENIRFICLWNKKGGDGPGGTRHMIDIVQKHSGQVYVLDTNAL